MGTDGIHVSSYRTLQLKREHRKEIYGYMEARENLSTAGSSRRVRFYEVS